jgi:hypothetical protein
MHVLLHSAFQALSGSMCQSARNVDPLSASNLGSDAISMTLGCSHDTCLKQIEFPAPVHLALDKFQLGDLALCLAV